MPDKPKIDFNKLEEYSNDSWYVLTPENTEFGPFAWKDLLGFVKQQRVTILHKLKHPSKTKGKWISVSAFSDLVAQIPAPAAVETPPPPDQRTAVGVDFSNVNRRDQMRSNSQGMFLDVVAGLIDWQFKRYVTPSIIRFTWVVLLALAFASLCWTIFSVITVFQVQLALDVAQQKMQAAQRIPVPVQPFKPQSFGIDYVVYICVVCVFSFLALLWVRVLMECVIVIFDISNNIKSIAGQKTTLQ